MAQLQTEPENLFTPGTFLRIRGKVWQIEKRDKKGFLARTIMDLSSVRQYFPYDIPNVQQLISFDNPLEPPPSELGIFQALKELHSSKEGYRPGSFGELPGLPSHEASSLYKILNKDVFFGKLPSKDKILFRQYKGKLLVSNSVPIAPCVRICGSIYRVWLTEFSPFLADISEAWSHIKLQTLAFLHGIAVVFEIVSDGKYEANQIFPILILREAKSLTGLSKAIVQLAKSEDLPDSLNNSLKDLAVYHKLDEEKIKRDQLLSQQFETEMKKRISKLSPWPPTCNPPQYTPKSKLEELILKEKDKSIIIEVGKTTNDQELIREFLSSELTSSIYSNPNLQNEQFELAARDVAEPERIDRRRDSSLKHLCQNSNLPKSALSILYKRFCNTDAGSYLADCPTLDTELALQLGNVGTQKTLATLIRRKDILSIEDRIRFVRKIKLVKGSYDLKLYSLEELIRDSDTPEPLLVEIAKKKDERLEKLILDSCECTPQLLEVLSKSPHKEIKLIIASRKDTPKKIIQHLAGMKAKEIAKQAHETLDKLNIS